ncbi:MAG: hypothetical protein C0403_09600 [Desulfobacterium sp.]|nr:hypothetical protein [Desulfobacterium sp.]
MLLYAVADIHGKKENLLKIRKNIDQYQPDILIVAGDITNYFFPKDTIDYLSDLSIPVLTVRGNSDFPIVDRLISKTAAVYSIHGKAYFENGFHFIGLGGAVLIPFRTKVCFREASRFREIESSLTDKSILVMHPPPFGVLDRVLGRVHSGSQKIHNIITQKQPLLFLCGHIHEDIGQSVIGKTTVVNCSIGKSGGGAIIQLETNQMPKVNFIQS